MLNVHRYDRASLEILDRINYVASLIETQCAAYPNTAVGEIPSTDMNISQGSQRRGQSSWSFPLYRKDLAKGQNDAETRDLFDSLEINGSGPSLCEDILEWPIFGGSFDRSRIETIIFNPSQAPRENTTHTLNGRYHPSPHAPRGPMNGSKRSRGINEEDAPSLVERFLINVHIKNPILEPDDTRRKARHITETGFTWDADSCLLVRDPTNFSHSSSIERGANTAR